MYLLRRLTKDNDKNLTFNALYRVNNYLNDCGLPTLTGEESDVLNKEGCLVFHDNDFSETISIRLENKEK